jgi:hypothetical protein
MTAGRNTGIAVRGAQTIERPEISQDNIVESLQKIYDLLGAAKLGRASENSVYVCGVLLRNLDKEMKDLDERIKKLETSQQEN